MTDVLERPRVRDVIRVAVVDDEELFRRGLVMLLGAEPDMDVVAEGSGGQAAADIATHAVPDVMLLDVRMPPLSGIDACRRIKDRAPAVKVIMLTASEEESDLCAAIKGGAMGYLLKDSSVDAVSEAVRRVARGQSLISPTIAARLLVDVTVMSGAEATPAPLPRLTGRQLEVLNLVAHGLNNREIAEKLFISQNTVKNHVRNMLEKLQLHSRIEAVMYAIRQRLLDPP